MSHPGFAERSDLMYLASDADGSGPWLHGVDVERRLPHRVSAVSTDTPRSRRVPTAGVWSRRWRVPKGTLWRLPITDDACRCVGRAGHPSDDRARIRRRGWAPGYLLYVSSKGDERQHLEARGRRGNRAVERAGHANHRRPRDRGGRTPHRVFSAQARRRDTAVRR